MHGAFLHEDRIFCIKTGGMESIACAFMFKAHAMMLKARGMAPKAHAFKQKRCALKSKAHCS